MPEVFPEQPEAENSQQSDNMVDVYNNNLLYA